MDAIKLIGVLIVVVGFMLKIDTITTVVLAGLVTGLVAGQSLLEVLEILGTAFISNRYATLFVLTLPAIGILERYGLKEKAVDFISSFKNATTGLILILYQSIRALSSAFSMRIGGHPTFVRPLIQPMAQAATEARYENVDEKTTEAIKGQSSAADNYGNFFAQNVFMGAAGTLLIVSTLNEQGYDEVNAANIAGWSIPIAVISVIVGAVFFLLLDRRIARNNTPRNNNNESGEQK